MNKLDAFVQKLNSLMPRDIEEELEMIFKKIYYPPQKVEGVFTERGDLLLDFISNYDVNDFDIAGVHLLNSEDLEENDDYICFGSNEGDYLVLSKKDGSVNIVDHESFMSCKCASSSERFLSNLLRIDEANLNYEITDDEKENIVNQIIEYEESRPFYLTLIGYNL